MTTLQVSGIILLCSWSGALSRKQELTYKVGIKLCAQRCFLTGSCIGIEMDSGQLHCQLIINEKTKKNDYALSKLHPVVWNGVPNVQCEANQRVIVTRRKRPKCVPGQRRLSHSKTLTSTSALASITDTTKNLFGDKAVGTSHGVGCKGKDQCGVKKSVCFRGICLCTTGLYFSPKQNACLRACDEYADGMDIYTGIGIRDYNDKILYHTSPTYCCDQCVREKAFTCLTAEWNKNGKCNLSSKGYMDVLLVFREKGMGDWSFAQRRCK